MKRTGGRCGTWGYGAHPETGGDYVGRARDAGTQAGCGENKMHRGWKGRKRALMRVERGENGMRHGVQVRREHAPGGTGKSPLKKPPLVRTVISASDERRRLKIHYRSA